MTAESPRDYPYKVVAARLRKHVAELSPHAQLPTIDQLAYDYEVSPGTVKRAVQILKDEQLVYGVSGLGIFTGSRNPLG